jgi:hypothetical protein
MHPTGLPSLSCGISPIPCGKRKNEIFHRNTTTAATDGRLMALQHQVTDYYMSFSTNSSFILLRFHDLFTQCTLPQCLQLSTDYLQSWILSVQMAIQATEIHITHQRIYHLSSSIAQPVLLTPLPALPTRYLEPHPSL